MLRLAKTASFRLSFLFAAIFSACFTILILITYFTTSSAMQQQLRRSIEEDAHALAAEVTSDGLTSIIKDVNARIEDTEGPSDYYYLADSSRKKLAGNIDTMSAFDGWRQSRFDKSEIHDSKIIGDNEDDDHELWGRGMVFADGSFLFVGQDAYTVIVAQEAILAAIGWSIALALLLAIGAGIFASRRFLGRIDAINVTSSAIMDGRFKERIPIKGTSDEMDQLSANLNRLFDSNQKLLESLKQVTTDIAHDLRSPLSRLRQELESARLSNSAKKTHEEAIDAAIEEADRLLAIFSGLLRIAQIESGSRKAGFRPTDLSEIVERVVSAYRAVAEDQSKALQATVEPGVQIVGDRDLLVQMFANLVENAIRHTSSGTDIALKLSSGPDGIAAEVTDSGPGIPIAERDKVFERLYRLDASRTTPGSGLGLSLVAAVAALHGIEIALADNNPGLRVILNIPRITPPPGLTEPSGAAPF
jgi:signal transduction histidine kinase